MSDITSAIKQICDEKNLSYEAVVETIESALAAAYRKDFGKRNQNIKVEFAEDITKSKVFDVKTVVEDLPEEELEEMRRFNPKMEIQLSDAKKIKKTAKIGDEIKIKLEIAEEYGRMAAQTAKQVIIQRLREAEREMVFNDFKDKEHEVVGGVIQRREGKIVLVDLGKSIGIIPYDEQIPGEKYNPGERIKVYVKEVALRSKGPEIILSRKSEEILKKVFYLEIPEISNGLIELKSVAREAGFRSKVAVWTDSENVDPIGSCVGQRGGRIQTIISELGGEKVDIILYDENPKNYISNALAPAKIESIKINEKEKTSKVYVSNNQLSLAIGKGGQNARLAARLTGWKIDIMESDKKNNPEELKEKEGAEAQDENKKLKTESKEKNKKEEKKKTETAEKEIKKEEKKKEDKKK